MTANPSTIATSENRLVFGLGETGRSVARWWRQQGVVFDALDTREEMADDPAVRAEIGSSRVVFGEPDASLFEGCSEMIVSPGVALDHPLIARAAERGCRIRGDIDLFMEAATAPVVGITGSNGKSTVTSLLGAMIDACGITVSIGGNLGRPALDLLADAPDLFVLELSSFQLERSEPLGLQLATVLNVSADHLDRYSSMAEYHQAKHAIFKQAHHVVANRDDPLTVPLLPDSVPVTWWRLGEPDLNEFGLREIDGAEWLCQGLTPLMRVDEIRIPGTHNQANVLVALALGSALGMPMAGLLEGAKRFAGLAHRCQLVGDVNGVRFIDDSKGTNVGATVAALHGLSGAGRSWLILGGQGKGQSFAPLRELVASHCAGLILLGEAAEEIAEQLGDVASIARVSSLEAAVQQAAAQAKAGDTVLLSPACASLDMFSSYQERGDRFQDAVQALEVAA
ncbi:MAG: UDP-N-acetylmuramoyl-L-alanine--D-glutamate ligase [Luminiphilus sp.]